MRAIAFASLVLCCVAAVSSTSIVHHRRVSLNAKVRDEYLAPGPNDCRSPCPALNTLANHGLLPHDGKNIDYAMLKSALIDVYGLGPTFGFVFARAATKKFATPATGKFSLCDLLINVHNNQQPSGATGIEHSASLSREDRPDFTRASDPTQRSPSQAQVDIVVKSSTDGKMITMKDFVKARGKLWDKSYAARPALKTDKLKTQEHIIADVEGCLLLGALAGNSNKGKFQISTAYAQSFLHDERFPVGWTKSSRSLGIPQLLMCLTQEGYTWAANEFTGIVELGKHWFGVV